MGYQRLMILGNVTNDPEFRTVVGKNGETEVASFAMAVNAYKDSVEYFDLEWWNPNGAMAYVMKGVPLFVEGEIFTDKWTKDGVKRQKKIVKIKTLQLVGSKKSAPEPDFASDFA